MFPMTQYNGYASMTMADDVFDSLSEPMKCLF